ncbi:MAG: AsmA family protein [Xanthomonadales bacterium]|nr:AsmA family protein [Xanthomonadales bacterium]
MVGAEEAETETATVDLSQISTGALSVDGLVINQTNLMTGESQSVTIDHIDVSAFSANQEVDIAMSGDIAQGDELLVQDLDIEGAINVAADLSRIGLSNLALDAKLPTAEATVSVRADGAVESLTPPTLNLSKLVGDVMLDDGTKAHIDSPLVLEVGDVMRLDMAALQATASMADGTELTLSSPLAATIGNSTDVRLARLNATVKAAAQQVDLSFNGSVNALVNEAPSVELGPSDIVLNGQNLSAEGRVQLGDQPNLNLNVQGSTLDLTPFIAASQTSEASTAPSDSAPADNGGGAGSQGEAAGAGGAEGAPQYDFSALQPWRMDMQLGLERLILPNLELEQVTGVMQARNGLITLNPLRARLFQGQFNGQATVDTRQNPPEVHLQPRLEGIAVQALLAILSPAAPARGAGAMDLDIRFKGLDVEQALSSLTGHGAFSILDGAIVGVDLNRLLNEEMSRSNFSNIRDSFGGETLFESLSGEFNADSGVLTLPAMDMETLQFGLSGAGEMDLRQQSLNYNMELNLGEQLRAQLPPKLVKATGGVIPLSLTGDITAPVVTVNMEQLLEKAVKKEVKKRGRKLLNNLFKRLEEKDEPEAEGEGGGS